LNISAAAPTAKTHASRLVELIRRDIMAGVLPPGTRLRIKALGERYDAGLIPLREALSRLSAVGLILAQEQRGFLVASVSRAELLDLLALRQNLEGLALRESIARGTLEWEAQLIAAHHRLMRQAGAGPVMGRGNTADEQEWDRAHHAFHHALLAACESPWLMRFVGVLFDQMNRYRHLSFHAANAAGRDVPGEHQALLDAALARDADTACRLMETHLAETAKLALKAMEGDTAASG
jgi:DNA-binding GntR family transcriptional regulator